MARRDDGLDGPDGTPGTARDSRSSYDYTGGTVERPEFVADLTERIDGEVRFDEYTRQLYATDASAYEVTPIGVVYPRSTTDVASLVEYCSDRDLPVLPRGAGTSLAGQAVNQAVVLDFSRHMDEFLSVDPAAGTATAQAGVLLGDLNAALADRQLKFAPDPAWGDKSTLGGAIGNNSTGSHSLQYGKTEAYIEECEVVLADGSVETFGDVSLETLEERATHVSTADVSTADVSTADVSTADVSTTDGSTGSDVLAEIYAGILDVIDESEAIRDAYPALERNVSGYNLDRVVEEAADDGTVNLARLLAGSEGTLAIVTEATVSLEPVPAAKAMALLRYDTLAAAMADVTAILEHDPAAVEVLDDVLLDLARDTDQFGPLVREMVPEGTGAVLLVEFYAVSDAEGKQRVADLLADRAPEAVATAVPSEGARDVSGEPPRATSADEAHDAAERERFWTLRKSGLPILLSRTTDAKHISFIEDVAVPPESLPDFVSDFEAVLDEHGTFASFYGHAGPGCLHVRPLVDTKYVDGVAAMESIADAVSDLAVEYAGSISGEHGDGRARTQWNRKQYGDDVWRLFREVKTAFDSDWLLNPGQVCGFAPDESIPENTPARAAAVQMTENLRFSPEYDLDLGFQPQLHWENDNGLQGMVELCHGCGGCRGPQETTGQVMCPTYRASQEEITSTRGRANALRQAMSGDLPEDPADEEFMMEVMDLCIGCKGCAHDCPSEVDMAKLKAELSYQAHQRGGPSLRDRVFANVDRLSSLASTVAPIPSLVERLPGSGTIREQVLGIARERDLPPFRRESFEDWWTAHEPAVDREDAREKAVLIPDTFTNYSYPQVGRAAVRVLEAAGVHVRLPGDVTASGRAAFSKGFLDTARDRARTNVDALHPLVDSGWDVIVVEPSDAVMFQSDYRDLLDGEAVERVAANTYGLCEYLDRNRLVREMDLAADATLTYHGHCHQKATNRDHHAVSVLRDAGFGVDDLDSGCCGMAGSFGYEAEHYAMSRAIGRILEDQVRASDGDVVVAPGASCRSQLAHGLDEDWRVPPTGTRTSGPSNSGNSDSSGRDASVPPHPVEMLAAALHRE